MTVIRPISAEEGKPFLQLLCEVFDLDYARAERIFFTEPLFDLSRKWALFENGEITSILTTVPLEFGWGRAFGIAGVATRQARQGRGHAAALLRHVLDVSREMGEASALLFARKRVLYERVGFEFLDEVIRSRIDHVPEKELPEIVPFDDVVGSYNEWARSHPDRLRRDERRWNYWKWNLRICTELGGGYICTEGGLVRECVLQERVACWPLPEATDWLGLKTMSEMLGVPLGRRPEHELHLMGYNVPSVPQMFMTDQF